MNVSEFVRGLRRRPIALVLIAALAVMAGVIGWTSTAVDYQSDAVVVVIPPGAGSPVATDNPFIHLDNSMAQLAAVLVSIGQSSEARKVVADQGASTDYTLTHIAGDSNAAQLSSQISFTISAPNPASSQQGAFALVQFMDSTILRQQTDSGIAPNFAARVKVAVPPTEGTQAPSKASRTAAAFAAAAAILGILMLMLFDSARLFLNRRRHDDANDASVSDPAVDAAPAVDSQLDPTRIELPSVPATQAGTGFGGWFDGSGREAPARDDVGVRRTADSNGSIDRSGTGGRRTDDTVRHNRHRAGPPRTNTRRDSRIES